LMFKRYLKKPIITCIKPKPLAEIVFDNNSLFLTFCPT
jgi:hypothetical protein